MQYVLLVLSLLVAGCSITDKTEHRRRHFALPNRYLIPINPTPWD